MRTRRTFMAPFVLVAATGCPGPGHSNPPGPVSNPPAPKHMTIEECKTVQVNATCAYDYGECSVGPADITCGLQGYDCKETSPGKFTWTEVTLPCPSEPAS